MTLLVIAAWWSVFTLIGFIAALHGSGWHNIKETLIENIVWVPVLAGFGALFISIAPYAA